MDINSIDTELDDTNSLSSSISAGLSSGKISLDDMDINSIDKELDDTNSLSNSISAGLSSGKISLLMI